MTPGAYALDDKKEMGMAKKRGELDAHIVFEADEDNFDRMRDWLISTFKEAARYSKDGLVVVGVYDEEGRMQGFSIKGTPTSEAQDMIDSVFESTPAA